MFLRFENQENPPVLLGEFLASENFFLFPGRKQTVRFQLRNPGSSLLETRLRIHSVPGLKISPDELKLNAEPGKTAVAEFTFDIPSSFREGEMELRIDAGNLWNGTLRSALKTAIQLTGEYGSAPAMTIDRPDQVVRLVPSEPSFEPFYWKGPQDVSCKVWMSAADFHLKLRAEVRDDCHCQQWNLSQVWRGDNIQLGIQLPRQDVFWEIGLTRRDDGTSEVFIWSLPDGFSPEIASRRISLKTARDDKAQVTVYEADIPFNAIGLTPEMGRRGFLFNLLVNDRDDGKTRESFISAVPGLGDTKNPATFLIVCF